MAWKWDRVTRSLVEVYSERGDVNAPYVIGDEMHKTVHPIDGRSYDSKSAFRAVTEAHGCVEIGNEKLRPRPDKRPPVSETLREVITQSGGIDRQACKQRLQQFKRGR